MRNEAYDKLVKEALERIEYLPAEKVTKDVTDIKNALEVVLAETDEKKLNGYYKKIEEFMTVNLGRGLEYLNGGYLLTVEE